MLKIISIGSYVQDGSDSPCRSVEAGKSPPEKKLSQMCTAGLNGVECRGMAR